MRIKAKREAAIHSEEVLRKLGVKLPRNRYTNFTTEMMVDSLQNNPRLLNIKANVKTLYGTAYSVNVTKPTKDFLKTNFGWMEHVTIIKKDPLKEVIPICPFVMDTFVRKLFRQIGYTRSGTAYRISAATIFSIIKKDKNFPRYIRQETVYEIISKPNIIHFPRRIFHMLRVLGLESTLASTLTSQLQGSADTYKMLTEAGIVSTNDNIVGQMDLSQRTYSRVCNVISTGNRILNSVLNVILMAFSIVEADRTNGIVHSYDLLYTNEGLKKMLIQFTGKTKTYKSLSYLNVFNI